MSRHLSIDIETYSSVDITKSGLYKYVQSDDFEILLFAYSVDGGDVNIIEAFSVALYTAARSVLRVYRRTCRNRRGIRAAAGKA